MVKTDEFIAEYWGPWFPIMLVKKSAFPVFTISDKNFAVVNFDSEVSRVFYRINIVVPCHKTLLHNSSKTLVIW